MSLARFAPGLANVAMWKSESVSPQMSPSLYGHGSPTGPTLSESGVLPAEGEAAVCIHGK